MKICLKNVWYISIIIFLHVTCTQTNMRSVSSPDGTISVAFNINEEGTPSYQIDYQGTPIMENSQLGLLYENEDFSTGLKLISVSKITSVIDTYSMLHGKKKEVTYKANRLAYHLSNSNGILLDIVFQVSNDGVVFNYVLPEESDEIRKISRELTSFSFPEGTTGWLQPRAKSKTGWNQVNPCYEEHYWSDVLLSSLSKNDSGWVFPALFHYNTYWISITETWPERNYCGSHLNKGKNPSELLIEFPEPTEGFTNGAVYPESKLPWSTPWRVITIGANLGTLVESTLGTDVAMPSVLDDIDYVRPGRASWSWVLLKDPSVNFKVQKEFIEYAAEMNWEYCLIDVGWDTTIGWAGIKELAEMAAQRNVGLILWYNSAGDWNTVPFHPKDKLLTSESRNKEFARLKELGIKGIKVDFFGGDGQSMMAYYIDILEDAHKYRLMVNCHGATLPRGLHRTYPNLVSMEAIRGLEYATFGQETADKVPGKSTIIPFTRNLFDPMDFTPVCFTEYDNNTRITGNGAELAQAVLFLSGIQHYAEIPSGMATVPDYVKEIMREIPVSWDETRFIDGYPGNYIIIARRNSKIWYVAGINAEKTEKKLQFHLPFKVSGPVLLITEGDSLRSFRKDEFLVRSDNSIDLHVKANGGFVLKMKEE